MIKRICFFVLIFFFLTVQLLSAEQKSTDLDSSEMALLIDIALEVKGVPDNRYNDILMEKYVRSVVKPSSYDFDRWSHLNFRSERRVSLTLSEIYVDDIKKLDIIPDNEKEKIIEVMTTYFKKTLFKPRCKTKAEQIAFLNEFKRGFESLRLIDNISVQKDNDSKYKIVNKLIYQLKQ